MRLAVLVPALGLVAGCGTVPGTGDFVSGQTVAFDGRVTSVDTAPWAYDGNAIVVVARDAGADVRVQLPARWNLCKAPPVDAQALKAGDRVQVVADAVDPGNVTVCARPAHRLVRIGG